MDVRHKTLLRLTTLLLVACATAPPAPQAPLVNGPKLLPAGDWTRDNTLTAFRGQVLDAIRAGNGERLFQHVDPDVRISFGPGGGITDFKRAWYERPLWDELRTIFYIGGGKFQDNDHFWAPYVYANWPEKYDAHSFVAVIGRNVPLRETEDRHSKTIATLSYDIVKRLPEKGHVRTADGRTGWVDPTMIWSPVGYRVGLVRKWGTWKIEALVSGD
jgi:hypothetical protein